MRSMGLIVIITDAFDGGHLSSIYVSEGPLAMPNLLWRIRRSISVIGDTVTARGEHYCSE